MEFNEIVKYLAENLKIQVDSGHTGELNNQCVRVALRIGDVVVSESDCEILINDSKDTRENRFN